MIIEKFSKFYEIQGIFLSRINKQNLKESRQSTITILSQHFTIFMKFKFSLTSIAKSMKFKVQSFFLEISSNSKEFWGMYTRNNFILYQGFLKAAHSNIIIHGI